MPQIREFSTDEQNKNISLGVSDRFRVIVKPMPGSDRYIHRFILPDDPSEVGAFDFHAQAAAAAGKIRFLP